MTRLIDIARELQLDVSVVSRALNPRPDPHAVVSSRTRERVLDAARRMGYRPNRQAAFLKKGSAATLFCWLPGAADRLVADLMFGISEGAMHENFPLNFFSGRDADNFGTFLRQAIQIGHSGLICYPPAKMTGQVREEFEQYRASGGKVLLLNTLSNADPERQKEYAALPQLNIDDEYGGRLAARHLLHRNCRKFYCIAAQGNFHWRQAGFTAELAAHGHEAELLSADRLDRLPDGREVGIFALCDNIAWRVLDAFSARGRTPGRDDSAQLVGFDDHYASVRLPVTLTTVHQPTRLEGALAVRKLVRMIFAMPTEAAETVKPYLMVRESTGGKRPDPGVPDSEEIVYE